MVGSSGLYGGEGGRAEYSIMAWRFNAVWWRRRKHPACFTLRQHIRRLAAVVKCFLCPSLAWRICGEDGALLSASQAKKCYYVNRRRSGNVDLWGGMARGMARHGLASRAIISAVWWA